MTKPDIKMFEKARHCLTITVKSMLDLCLSHLDMNIWIQTVVGHELNYIIDRMMAEGFPNLSKNTRPQYSYRVFKSEEGISVDLSIQEYINEQSGLSFLGNYIQNGVCNDLYLAPYYDGVNHFIFYARYGHKYENFTSGSSVARSQYHLGLSSPLSVAYGMAVHDGYVNG